MDHRSNRIAELLAFLEDHLDQPLVLDQIAVSFGYSPYHLHRLFTQITGIPMKTYIRKRRLALSLKLLTDSSLKIIDIALQSGFEYEQSFIRAFREEFGLTPSKYRKNGGKLTITPPLSLKDLEMLHSGVVFPPVRVFLPSMELIGMKRRIPADHPEYFELPNRTAIKFIRETSFEVKGELDRSVYYAKVDFISPDRRTCDYTPSYVAKKVISSPPELSLYRLPSQYYILFKYIGQHSPYNIDMHALSGIYRYIWGNYADYLMEHSPLKYKLERADHSACGEDYCEMDFLFPITEKRNDLFSEG